MIKFQSKNPNDILEQLQKEICCLDEQIQQIVIGGLGWALSGNVVLPTSFIGSTNLADFVVKTNNAERMRVVASGLVGINTSTPTAPLDINGQIRVRGGSPGAGKVLTSDANGLATWEVINIPPGGVTGAESGLHLQGTVARLGGPLLETAAIIGDAPTKKVIFQGVVDFINGDWTDAYVLVETTGEGPSLGIHSASDGVSIDAAENGINITGGVFGVNVIGETTGVVSVGNTLNGGDFNGLHGGLNVTYGRQTDTGQGTDFGVKVTANGIGSKGTPIFVQVPTFSGTLQNMLEFQQTTNSVVGNGYGQSIRFSYGQPGGGSVATPVNELRSVWSNVASFTQAFQLWSPTPGNLTAIQQTFTVYNSGQLQLNKYTGATPFAGGTRMLTVDTVSGAVFTQAIPAFSGLTAANSGVRTDGTTVKLGGQLLENASIPILDATLSISVNGMNSSANSPTFSVSTTGDAGTAIRGTATAGFGYAIAGIGSGVANTNTGQYSAGVYGQSSGLGYAMFAENLGTGTAFSAKSNGGYAITAIGRTSTTTAQGIYAQVVNADGFTPGAGTAVSGYTGTGIGVLGAAQSTGKGVYAVSGSGLALDAVSSLKCFAFALDNATAPTTGVHIIGSFAKTTSGFVNAANGFGGSIDHILASDTGAPISAGTFAWKWSIAAAGTRTSQFDFNLIGNAVASTALSINGSGRLILPKYGINTFAGAPAYSLGVDATGNVVEFTPTVAATPGIDSVLAVSQNLTTSRHIRVNGNNLNIGETSDSDRYLSIDSFQVTLGDVDGVQGGSAIQFTLPTQETAIGNLANGSLSQIVINDAQGVINYNYQGTQVGQFQIAGLRSSIGSHTPTAGLDLRAGTQNAGDAPLKFRSGTLMTTPEVGAHEFLTDKLYFTITTGAARKEITLNNAPLTFDVPNNRSTVPMATTNGRLTDSPIVYDGINTRVRIDASARATQFEATDNALTPTTVTQYRHNGVFNTVVSPSYTISLNNTSSYNFVLGGGVKIGDSNPATARLHIIANAAGTANRTPLKFTAGTLVAAPEDGAFEYSGTNLYYTIGTTRLPFLFDTGGGAGSIYTTDGALGGPRVITGASFPLTFDGTSLFRIKNGNATVGGIYDFNTAVNLLAFDAANSSNIIADPIAGVKLEYATIAPAAVVSGVKVDALGVHLTGVPTYADQTAATGAGLTTGYLFKTAAGALQIVL